MKCPKLNPSTVLENPEEAAAAIVALKPDAGREYDPVVLGDGVERAEQKLELLRTMGNALGCVIFTRHLVSSSQSTSSNVIGDPENARRVCEAFPIVAAAMDQHIASLGGVSCDEGNAAAEAFVSKFSSVLRAAMVASLGAGGDARLQTMLDEAWKF